MLLFSDSEWSDEEEGCEAILKSLRKVALCGYDVSVFVRRLAWVPLNFPCQLDGGDVCPAEKILVCTETDPQVLTGYWIALDDLVALFGLIDPGTVDFAFFRTCDLSLLGSLTYFEGWFVERSVPTDMAHPWTSNELGTELPQSFDRDRFMVVESTIGQSSKSFLSKEGLSLAQPLPLMSSDGVIRKGNLSLSPIRLELKDVVDIALCDPGIVAFSEDGFRNGRMGCFSLTWTIDHLRFELETYHSTPYGAFFFYDESWNLCTAATKRAAEANWDVLRLAKRE